MILADTSVWIDHLRKSDTTLAGLLEAGRVAVHPFVIGEIALGNLRNRKAILASLSDLPAVSAASDDEVLAYIGKAELAGTGIGYLDAHLLASARLTPGVKIWTRDKKLKTVAQAVGLAMASD